MATSPDDLISTAEAAKLLCVSPQHVRTHARAGRLAGTVVGRDWVFRRGDVKAFRDEPRRKPGRPPVQK